MMRLIADQGAEQASALKMGSGEKLSRARERAGRGDNKDWGALMN